MSLYDTAMLNIAVSQLNLAASAMNIAGTAILIYGTLKLRKATRTFQGAVEEWSRAHPIRQDDEYIAIPRLDE